MTNQKKSTRYLALAAKAAAEEGDWELLAAVSKLLTDKSNRAEREPDAT